MKLEFIKTDVHVSDKETNDKWVVEFTGHRTNLHGRVYKNNHYISTYSPAGGHANKTMALHIIKSIILKTV